jgi:hypothetical protein
MHKALVESKLAASIEDANTYTNQAEFQRLQLHIDTKKIFSCILEDRLFKVIFGFPL